MARATSETAPSLRGRMIQLDILRGLAILLVLARHSPVPWSLSGFAQPVMLSIWRLGWTGVDLFFVLSGFLIGGLLFKEIRATGRLDVGRFLVRRGLKIWPAYFVYLAAVLVIDAQRKGLARSFHAILPNLIHLQNYLGTPRGQTWSLAVEEHFYLVLPLFLVFLLWLRPRGRALAAVPITAAVLVVGCTLARILLNGHHTFEMYTDQTPTHLRIDGLFFGVLLAYLHHLYPNHLARVARHRGILLLVGLALISPMFFYDLPQRAFNWTVGFTMLYLGYGMILIALVYTVPGQGIMGKLVETRLARLIAWIGVFSYSIYLWQFDVAVNPVARWVLPHLPHHPLTLLWLMGSAVYLVLAVVAGAIAAKLVEIPALAVRDRLFPPRVGGASVDRVVEPPTPVVELSPVVTSPGV